MIRVWDTCGPYLVLLVGIYIMFLTAPTGGNFTWSDAPRHDLMILPPVSIFAVLCISRLCGPGGQAMATDPAPVTLELGGIGETFRGRPRQGGGG